MSSTGFAPLSVWLRTPRNLEDPEGHFFCEINNNTIHLSFEIYFDLQGLPYVRVLEFRIWFYFQDSFYTVMFSPALQHNHRNFYQYPRLSRTSSILST